MASEEKNLLKCATNKFGDLTEDEEEFISKIQKDDPCDDKAAKTKEAAKLFTYTGLNGCHLPYF